MEYVTHDWQEGQILTARAMNELEAEVVTALQIDAVITNAEIDELFNENSEG